MKTIKNTIYNTKFKELKLINTKLKHFFNYRKKRRYSKLIMKKLNIVALDFEFINIERSSLVLISGAIANIHIETPTIKLIGTSLILTKEPNTVTELPKNKINLIIRRILKIFNGKEHTITPILNELNDSFLVKTSNLHAKFIQNYCQYKHKIPIIITWNGHNEKEILKRLNINYTVLSLTSYDINNNGIFFLQLINLHNKQNIAQVEIGKFNKRGRLMNLNETHNMVCNKIHGNTYLHDPVMDVNLTKCLFHYLNNKTEIPIRDTLNIQ